MDTIYYHLNAKRVKVSGGADLLTFVPAAPAGTEGGGEVLDFTRCRQKLETKAAWKALSHAVQEVPEAEEKEEVCYAPVLPSPKERAAGWLELCASAAVIAVSVAAVVAFLRLI